MSDQIDAENRITVLVKNATTPDELAGHAEETAALCDQFPTIRPWARALYRERMAQMNQGRAKLLDESGRDFG